MGTNVNRLTNANIYQNGANFLGMAEEITLPVIKSKMSEHKALGMNAAIELVSGMDKLEARIKWNSFYPDAMVMAANPFAAVQIQCRSSLEVYSAAGRLEEQPVVCYMTAQYKDFPLGNFKQSDNVELESTLNVTYVKLVINGREIVEVDTIANIYKVDGVDLLANYRANLGI